MRYGRQDVGLVATTTPTSLLPVHIWWHEIPHRHEPRASRASHSWQHEAEISDRRPYIALR